MKKPKYEIVNHGYEHSQYFQGCGTSLTPFDSVVTGIGDNAVEAYNDAVEQVYSSAEREGDAEWLHLPKRPWNCGITLDNKVPYEVTKHEGNEVSWRVSIRYLQRKVKK